MRRLTLILGFVVVLAVLAFAALVPIKIPSPGATGMNSNADVQELKITDSPYLENVNTQRLPGQINKRFPLRSVNDNDVEVYAVFGYYDPTTGMKQIVAVADGRDSFITGFTSDTTFYALSADTIAPYIEFSNRFEGGIDETVKIAGFLGAPPYRSVLFDGVLAITSKGSVPLAYSPYQSVVASDENKIDTSIYSPHVFSIGLEAPGQPRAGVLNDTGILFGVYRWAYGDVDSADYSLCSRWVSLDSQKAYITLFEPPPYYSPNITFETIDDVILVELIRQKFGQDWSYIDTFTMRVGQPVVFVDNAADDFSYKAGTPTHISTEDANRIVYGDGRNAPPGGLYRYPLNDTLSIGFAIVGCGLGNLGCADSGATYYVAFSYYDPETGIESPIGPIWEGIVTDSVGDLSPATALAFMKSWTKIEERAPWIRVYRGLAGDSVKWYAVAQLRVNDVWPDDVPATVPNNLKWAVYPANRHDSQLVAASERPPYIDNSIPIEEDGSALIRPPYIEQLEISYTDITYSNGRFWGIGDPLFPLRLYYSTYNDMFQWSAISFLSMNEDDVDELVAIEALPSQNLDVLFAIAHNTTYMVSGYDPEFDLTWQTISSEIGAINRSTVIRKGDAIYFLAMNMRIYELTSSRGLREISQPIEDYIDTLFTDAETAAKICKVYALQDKIIFSDTANNRALVYVPRSNWWGIEQYKNDFEPIGSFQYDSTRGNFSQDQSGYWIYQGGTGEKFVVEFTPPTSGSIVDTINGSNFNYSAIYRTPYVGDGQNLYQITKCDIVGRWTGGTMKIRIVNGFGVLMDSVEVSDLTPQTSRIHTIGFPVHQDSHLALEFVSNSAVQRYDIHSVVIHYQKVGSIAVK